jgi:signal transduction histidine kinase
LTQHEDKDEQPLFMDANHERPARFTSELIHEFTNVLTAVIGYSELALHAIEDSHPSRQWLEKIQKHTRELGSLLHKFVALKRSKDGERL